MRCIAMASIGALVLAGRGQEANVPTPESAAAAGLGFMLVGPVAVLTGAWIVVGLSMSCFRRRRPLVLTLGWVALVSALAMLVLGLSLPHLGELWFQALALLLVLAFCWAGPILQYRSRSATHGAHGQDQPC